MTYEQIFNAFSALTCLSRQRLKVRESFKLYDFTESINRHYDFFRSERKKIMDAHGIQGLEDDTTDENEERTAAENEVAELFATEVEGVKELELTVPDDIVLSRDDIERLTGVIKLKFEE